MIGLVELHLHDEHGNLLQIAKGKNIIFDDARIAMIMNPGIISDPSLFTMFFSEFEERAVEELSIFYWNSSLLSHYATSAIIMDPPEVLNRHSLQSQDILSYLYTFTSNPILPGASARTLRTVGLRLTSPGQYCTAIVLNDPIDHGLSTYVTGYYKIIWGVNEDSYLYENVQNWKNQTWYNESTSYYKKGFVSGASIGVISSENISLLAARPSLQSGSNTITINSGLSGSSLAYLFGGKIKGGNPSIALLKKDLSLFPPYSKSRTFLHSAGSSDFYGYGNAFPDEPSSVGSIRVEDIDSFRFPYVNTINITKSGVIGESEYNVTMYPHALTEVSKFPSKIFSLFSDQKSTNFQWLSYNAYYSENRLWGSAYYLYYGGENTSYYLDVTKSTYIVVWYKGLHRRFNLDGNTLPIYQNNGVISNTGCLFYAWTTSLNILRKYDIEQIYVADYVEETSALNSNTEILNYQIDESDGKIVVLAQELGSELVVNGTFDTDTSGWTAEALVTLSVVDQQLDMSMASTHVSPNGCYQDISTVIGSTYKFSIDFTYGTPTLQRYNYWRIDIGDVTSFIYPTDTSIDNRAVLFTTYSNYFTATSTTTRIRICATRSNSEYNLRFDNVSLKEVSGKIVKFDINNISSYTEYKSSHPNFTSLTSDSLLFTLTSGFTPFTARWYWRVFNKKMVWLTGTRRFVYWDGENEAEYYDVSIAGTIVDVCISDDHTKLCFAAQNGTSVTWKVLDITDGSRWTELYTVTRTVSNIRGAGCFVDSNWMYQLSDANNWGYRLNLITFVTESWPVYTYNASYIHGRPVELPNRSIYPGTLMYNIWSRTATSASGTRSWLFISMSPNTYGWDGSKWVHNHSGSKITHRKSESLPICGSLGFGIEEELPVPTENYVMDEYFSFAVNPAGYVFDNTMTHTGNYWVYVGIPYYYEETIFLFVDPLHPTDPITITLKMAEHPDFLCVETSEQYTQIMFDNLIGKKADSISYLSYIGEYYITPSGNISFHCSCNGLSVTIKYYWIKREL